MFRTTTCMLLGALLLAGASTLAGRGSMQQFELTVVPSMWTFAAACGAGLWAFGLRGTRSRSVRVSLILACAALVAALPGTVPFILLAGFVVDRAARRHRLAGAAAIGAVALVTACQLPAFWLGVLLNRADVSDAKLYCEEFVPRLESHYERTGTYPRSLMDLSLELGEVPRLLDPTVFYTRAGNRFQFSFNDPSGRDGGLCYDSFVGSWREYS
ncbi:MAG: hypothetical protein ACI8QZ_002748 [Chlamydiales bacterium]|jgi:hypothetical protein